MLTEAEPFLSIAQGAVQRLSNGNALISESARGRALEVTMSGEIVWEFYNTHRAGEGTVFIATVANRFRLPLDFGAAWLEEIECSP
jgi:hypothetical protein